jgi:predicted phosphodiesterase
MRIQVMSDLHLEFHADGGASFVESLDPSGVDVLVLAGDIDVGSGLPAALGLMCRHFAGSQVLYVHGNHEFYHSSFQDVQMLTRQVARRHRNLQWLEQRTVRIGGQRFLGATLWFAHDEAALHHRGAMNDFLEIQGFETWVYEVNRRTVSWLRKRVCPGDVVVTHHLPSPKAVAPCHAKSPLNPFFVCDLEQLMLKARPALWLFGHTHTSADFVLGDTRLICNPLGYVGAEQNARFDERLMVEI